MRQMIRSLCCALLATAIALPAMAADLGANINPSAAVKGGWWEADMASTDGGGAFGLEFAIDNLGAAPTFGKWHHMFSWNHSDHDGLELNSAEWNLHWMVEAKPNLWIGAGPGIGWVWADGKDDRDSAALQLGASAHTFVGHALFGLEARYQWTQSDSTDNWLTMMSIGYRF